jgi:hypothetical protein
MNALPVAETSRTRWIARRTAAVITGKDGMVKQVARPPVVTLVADRTEPLRLVHHGSEPEQNGPKLGESQAHVCVGLLAKRPLLQDHGLWPAVVELRNDKNSKLCSEQVMILSL